MLVFVHETSPTPRGSRTLSESPDPDAAAGSAAIQSDPLLESGAFIDAAAAPTEGGARPAARRPNRRDSPKTASRSDGAPTAAAAESNFDGMSSPTADGATESAGTPAGSAKRSRKRGSEPSGSLSASGRPSWLPENWRVEDKVRTSGATAGTVDKYYVDPVSGFRFRSKNEVLHFLETGSKRKIVKTKAKGNPDVETEPTEAPKSNNQKSSGSKAKSAGPKAQRSEALKFDYADVPEGVQWVLSDASGGVWTPFIGDEMMPESRKREWAAAFELISQR